MEEWKMQEFIPVELFFQCAEFMDTTRWACCCSRDKDWMVEQTVQSKKSITKQNPEKMELGI